MSKSSSFKEIMKHKPSEQTGGKAMAFEPEGKEAESEARANVFYNAILVVMIGVVVFFFAYVMASLMLKEWKLETTEVEIAPPSIEAFPATAIVAEKKETEYSVGAFGRGVGVGVGVGGVVIYVDSLARLQECAPGERVFTSLEKSDNTHYIWRRYAVLLPDTAGVCVFNDEISCPKGWRARDFTDRTLVCGRYVRKWQWQD